MVAASFTAMAAILAAGIKIAADDEAKRRRGEFRSTLSRRLPGLCGLIAIGLLVFACFIYLVR